MGGRSFVEGKDCMFISLLDNIELLEKTFCGKWLENWDVFPILLDGFRNMFAKNTSARDLSSGGSIAALSALVSSSPKPTETSLSLSNSHGRFWIGTMLSDRLSSSIDVEISISPSRETRLRAWYTPKQVKEPKFLCLPIRLLGPCLRWLRRPQTWLPSSSMNVAVQPLHL